MEIKQPGAKKEMECLIKELRLLLDADFATSKRETTAQSIKNPYKG
jgi:hypothetical protein